MTRPVGTVMASQRVLLLSIGGPLAERIWEDVCRWSAARPANAAEQWSSEYWPDGMRDEVNSLANKLVTSAFTPPVLYRSEHVDLWSMGDVFQMPLVNRPPDRGRQLFTDDYDLFVARTRSHERIKCPRSIADETKWFYARLNEALSAWGDFCDERLIVCVRSVMGGLWTDDEVTDALQSIPEWWNKSR